MARNIRHFLKNGVFPLILRSQEFTKIDTLYFLHGGFWLVFNHISSIVASIILGLAFANLIPKEIYGTYSFMLALFSLLSLTTLPGTETALVQAASRGQDGALTTTVRARLRWGTIGSVIALLLSGFYFFKDNLTLALCSLFLAAFLPANLATSSFDFFLQGKKRFDLSAKYSLSGQLGNTFALLACLVFFKNPVIILLFSFSATLAANIIFLTFSQKLVKNDHVGKNFLAYGKHLTLVGFLSTVTNYVDIPLIFHFLGSAPAAVYTLAIAPTDQIKALFKIVANLALPKLSLRTAKEIKRTMARHIFLLSLAALFLAGVYISIAPLLFHFLFPQYTDAVIYSQFVAVSFLSFPLFIVTTAMQATNKTKSLYQITTVPAIAQLLLLIILTPTLGIGGAITAKIVGRIFTYLLALYLYYRHD